MVASSAFWFAVGGTAGLSAVERGILIYRLTAAYSLTDKRNIKSKSTPCSQIPHLFFVYMAALTWPGFRSSSSGLQALALEPENPWAGSAETCSLLELLCRSCECFLLLITNKHLDSVIYFSMTWQGYQLIHFLFHLSAKQARLPWISACVTASHPFILVHIHTKETAHPLPLKKLQARHPVTQSECQSGRYSSMRTPAKQLPISQVEKTTCNYPTHMSTRFLKKLN